jgi:hypothetical protein
MAVDGTYEISIQTPMGNQTGTLTLKTNGTDLTGTSEVMGAESPLQNGKVDGDAFDFMVEASTPMGAIELTIKGKVDGDELTGEATSPFGPAPMSGKRTG